MGTEWITAKASEVCGKQKSAMSTGPFGSAISSKYFTEAGVPVIRGSNLSQDVGIRLDHENLVFITKEKAAEFERSTVEKGDLIFTCWGTIDQIGLIDERCEYPRYVISNKQMKMTPDHDIVDSKFLYYQFSSPKIQRWIVDNGIGSSVPGFNLGMLKGIELSVPPFGEQRAIARILGTLDDKIEVNRKTNETLEGIAKALFKSWFVDFDAVRAKAEGRPTGLPDEISELFPDSLEESELGEIPSGWAISSVKDQSSYLSRGISPKYCEDGGGVVVLNQKCIRGGAVDFLKSRRHDPSKKKIEGRQISKFDCLINSTGVGTLGRVAIVPGLEFGDVIVDSHVTTVRGHDEQSTFYLTNALLNRQSEIEALGEGSTGQTELSRVVLGEMELVVPPEALLNFFYSSMVCIFEKRWANEATSTTLASLRDALLPKLISGELRVPDAEKMLEEVGI